MGRWGRTTAVGAERTLIPKGGGSLPHPKGMAACDPLPLHFWSPPFVWPILRPPVSLLPPQGQGECSRCLVPGCALTRPLTPNSLPEPSPDVSAKTPSPHSPRIYTTNRPQPLWRRPMHTSHYAGHSKGLEEREKTGGSIRPATLYRPASSSAPYRRRRDCSPWVAFQESWS